MIKYNPKTWAKLIFRLTKNDIIKKILPYFIFVSIYTTFIVWFLTDYLNLDEDHKILNISTIYEILGFVLSLLLAFRTNTAYDRWWEGRKALGTLNNATRSLSIKLAYILKNNKGKKQYFAALISSFVIALKNNLQGKPSYELIDIDELKIDKKDIYNSNLPINILLQLNNEIENLHEEKYLRYDQYLAISVLHKELVDVVGICERIKNTPIPYSYSSFIKKFIFIYIITLPIAWMFNFGYFTVLAVSFVLYVLVGLEILAEEIENPFGTDENDLPFDEIAKNIKLQTHHLLLKE